MITPAHQHVSTSCKPHIAPPSPFYKSQPPLLPKTRNTPSVPVMSISMNEPTELALELQNRIRNLLPDAEVNIEDPDGAHLSAIVTSMEFVGLSRIAQHRLVYQALGDAFETDLHALQLTTRAPQAQ